MDLVFELFLFLIFKPLISFCQALAGIMTETTCVRLIRAQRMAAGLLIVGSIAVAVAIIAFCLSANFWFCFWSFLIGVALLLIAGSVGHHVETKVKERP